MKDLAGLRRLPAAPQPTCSSAGPTKASIFPSPARTLKLRSGDDPGNARHSLSDGAHRSRVPDAGQPLSMRTSRRKTSAKTWSVKGSRTCLGQWCANSTPRASYVRNRPTLHSVPGFHPPRGNDKIRKVDLVLNKGRPAHAGKCQVERPGRPRRAGFTVTSRRTTRWNQRASASTTALLPTNSTPPG